SDDTAEAYRTAVGYRTEASGIAATAIGQFNRAQGKRSVAVGYEATAEEDDALAIGSNATASQAGSVALGSGSSTEAAVGTAGITLAGTAYAFAGANPVATVSVGSAGQERTITNVAAGRISADSTDAINGSQLYSLQQAFEDMHWDVEVPPSDNSGGNSGNTGGSGNGGSNSGGNTGGGSDGNSTPIYNGGTVGFAAADDNIVVSKTNRADGSGANVQVGLAQDIKVNSITAVKVQADEIKVGNNGPIINENGIDMNGKPITNGAAGV